MNEAKVVKRREITQGELKENLHYDPLTGIFIWSKRMSKRAKIGDIAGYYRNGYIVIGMNGKEYKAHRLAWLYMTGKMPIKDIDHKDGVKDNNRFDNLREALRIQNMQNIRVATKRSTTGFLGVCFNKAERKYMASISIGGKNKHIGYFSTPEEAHEAYLTAKRQYHEYCTI